MGNRDIMRTLLTATILVSSVLAVRAESIEAAIIAAMNLSDARSYAWSCTVVDDAQSYLIEGKTDQGYTWQRQPMPRSIAKRLGRGAERELEAIFRAPLEYVIRTERGWQTLDELPREHPDWSEDSWYFVAVPMMHGPDMPADLMELDSFGLPSTVYVPVLQKRDEAKKPYSNAQFARSLPHDQLAIIVSSHVELENNGEVARGTLSDLGAQLLLVHDGHEYIKPVVAAGRFTLWIRDGCVIKYKIDLAGVLVVEREPVYVRQTSTTVLREIGTASLALPVEARRKLNS
jgi:hypothetical protein